MPPPPHPRTLNDSDKPTSDHEAVSGSMYHSSNQLSQEQISHLLDTGSPAAFMTLYHHSILTVSPIDGFHAFLCPHCHIFIKSSISISFSLLVAGHFTVLSNHYRHKSCTAQHARNEGSNTQLILRQQCLNSAPDSSTSASCPSPSSSFSESESSNSPVSVTSSSTISDSGSHSNPTVYIPPLHPPCHGLPFQWDLAPNSNIQVSLPWLRTLHGRPDELPYTFNILDGQAYARSLDCTRFVLDTSNSCPACVALGPALDELGKLIPLYQPRTRRSLKNVLQLSQMVDEHSKELERWKLKSLNDARSISNKLSTINSHSALLMAISQTDVPWLQRILQIQIKNGAGINTIIRRIEEALEKGYKPRGYSNDAYDLVLLVYRIGGANLLYALNRRMSIPSLRTLRTRLSFVTIAPTIGPIVLDTISANILNVIVGPRAHAGLQRPRGVSILTDEIALEEAVVFFPSENGVGGLCWKHSHVIDPILNTYDSAVQIASKLDSGQVHLGKEMTVTVVHLFGEDETYPLLAAPSCKEEDYTDWEKLINMLIDAWMTNGADKTVGPLWSFATDGDSTRRKAGHRTFVHTMLDESSPLYGILADIPGLNLYTGRESITLDFDYKHIFKRFCTMLRSSNGMVLGNGRRMDSTKLERYLTWLDDCDNEKAKRLLYPDDPQDVPRAIELMRAIIKLGRIDPTKPPYTPPCQDPNIEAYIDFETLRMLGDLFHNLLEPFVNPSLSLTQQVVHLSTFAHLLFTFYRGHRRSFMPNQLYYDSQTLVKNVIFCIAKQQRLDASQPFFLLDVGDDAIKLLFAFLRMCGGHNSALNYKQAIDRLRAARDIGGVYSRNPDLRHGHRRLNLSRTEHLDHIHRDMWSGDILSHNVNLRACWLSGRDVAISLLSGSPTYTEEFDYEGIFSNPNVDMLRVFGAGLYPGITEDEDEDTSIQVTFTPPESASVKGSVPGVATNENLEIADENPILDLEEQLESLTINDSTSESTCSIVQNLEPSMPPLPTGPGIRPNDFLAVEGKYVHKASFCRIYFNSSFKGKSHDRLRRVRGFTSVKKIHRTEDISSPDDAESIFVAGSPFLTLIRLNDQTTALAFLRSTSIVENGVPRTGINVDTLRSPAAKVKISGDLLLLHHVPVVDLETSMNMWVWTGGYLKSLSPVPKANVSTRKVIELSVQGSLTEPVNPSVVAASEYLPNEHRTEVNSRDITWALKEDVLEAASTTIWKRLDDLKVPISSITLLSGRYDGFPYSKDDGTPALLCAEAAQALSEANVTNTEVLCALCHKPTSDLRSHMGGHILRSIRRVPDELVTPVGQVLPCGFCGSSGNPDCAIKLKKTKRATEVITNCPHKVPFKYGFAEKGSESRPCRNVPVVCGLCPHRERKTDAKPAIWRYNMEEHLSLSHPEYAHPGKIYGLPLPLHMIDTVVITVQEEKKFSVPARSNPEKPSSTHTANHQSTHPPAPTSSGQKRQADVQAGQFRLIISSSNGTKRARMAKD
ncbi:hypothetical protein JVU11DRAFT_9974 [Chiua virens]|nr:hypothetical protein JVU11DRAFT_9974 [Chiua virens]